MKGRRDREKRNSWRIFKAAQQESGARGILALVSHVPANASYAFPYWSQHACETWIAASLPSTVARQNANGPP